MSVPLFPSFVYLRNHTAKLHQIFVPVAYIRASVLLWRHCNTLCISGFADDVMFPTQWLYGASGVFLSGESIYNSRNRCIDRNRISLTDDDQQVHTAPGRSLLSTIAFGVRCRHAHLRGTLPPATHPRGLDAARLSISTTRWYDVNPLFFTPVHRYTHCKNIHVSTDIWWRVLRILTEPVPYTFASVNRRNNAADRGRHCDVRISVIVSTKPLAWHLSYL